MNSVANTEYSLRTSNHHSRIPSGKVLLALGNWKIGSELRLKIWRKKTLSYWFPNSFFHFLKINLFSYFKLEIAGQIQQQLVKVSNFAQTRVNLNINVTCYMARSPSKGLVTTQPCHRCVLYNIEFKFKRWEGLAFTVSRHQAVFDRNVIHLIWEMSIYTLLYKPFCCAYEALIKRFLPARQAGHRKWTEIWILLKLKEPR